MDKIGTRIDNATIRCSVAFYYLVCNCFLNATNIQVNDIGFLRKNIIFYYGCHDPNNNDTKHNNTKHYYILNKQRNDTQHTANKCTI